MRARVSENQNESAREEVRGLRREHASDIHIGLTTPDPVPT